MRDAILDTFAPRSAGDDVGRFRADDSGPVTDPGPCESPQLIRLADVEPKPLVWLWPGRIPLGKLTLIAGDPNLGKSFLTLDVVARVSTGTPWPDARDDENPRGGAILLSAEDDIEDTIRPRLDAARADVDRVFLLNTVKNANGRPSAFSFARDLPVLESAIDRVAECRVVVIDPISAYLGSTDSHKNAELRGLLGPLAELAARKRVAVVCVTHLTKAYGGKALYRATGSLAFVAAARAAWLVVADQESPGRRLLLLVKMNLAAEAHGLAYRIGQTPVNGVGDTGIVAWEPSPVDVTADEVLAREADRRGLERSERENAGDWLRELLAKGPVLAETVKAEGKTAGFSWPTTRRAKDEIGVRVSRLGFGPGGKWRWSLPDHRCSPDPIGAQAQGVSSYEENEHLCGDGGNARNRTEGDDSEAAERAAILKVECCGEANIVELPLGEKKLS